jgi:hypothetical protein
MVGAGKSRGSNRIYKMTRKCIKMEMVRAFFREKISWR